MSSVSEENLRLRHHFKVVVSSRVRKRHIVPALMTERVQTYPIPKKVEEVQTFVGMLGILFVNSAYCFCRLYCLLKERHV